MSTPASNPMDPPRPSDASGGTAPPAALRARLNAIAALAPPKPTADMWTTNSDLPTSIKPECPRCGYDLSGQLAAAHTQSPRPHDGTCSECGLTFEWRLVLSPGLAGWLWFIESAGKRLHRACLTTTWRALNPSRFWRDVRLETLVVPRRIARWGATVFGVLLLALAFIVLAQAVAFAAVATRTVTWSGPFIAGAPAPTPTGLTPASLAAVTIQNVSDLARRDLFATWNFGRTIPPRGPATLTWALGATLMAPIVVLALPHTRARAKVRYLHLLRATAYSFSWLAVLCVWSVGLRLVELFLTITDAIGQAGTGASMWGFTARRLPFSAMHGGFAILAGIAIAVWLGVYWSFALSRGWRMRFDDAVPAIFSIFACSALAGFAFAFWFGELLPR